MGLQIALTLHVSTQAPFCVELFTAFLVDCHFPQVGSKILRFSAVRSSSVRLLLSGVSLKGMGHPSVSHILAIAIVSVHTLARFLP